MPGQDFIVTPEGAPISVALEPAHNALYSLLLLSTAEHMPGLAAWVTRTASALTPSERRQHDLVIIGLHHALPPEQSWSSFPAYLNHLATCNPDSLRDKMLAAYARMPLLADRDECCTWLDEPAPIDLRAILRDTDSYLDFLRERFGPEKLDVELEAQAYSLVIDPPTMQNLIVSHLQKMWDEHLAPEWERVEPMLRDSVKAFRQSDLSNKSRLETAEFITGQELKEEKWGPAFERAEQVIFVPSAHVAPYVGKLGDGDTLWVLFGARIPEGVHFYAPDLSRAEIAVRLDALADDVRLRILRLIAEKGELQSQEIMATLGLSQSAASRHLKQLSATGYLSERRCNGAKCYKLNPERIEDMLHAVSGFLLSK